jgi:NAD(P)-dependent dehydrogenase (short-subunit alcohol dehydrogenase family)
MIAVDPPMAGKVCLVTGATSGIGAVAAEALAAQGATLVGVGRNPEKCAAVAERIRQQTGSTTVEFLRADLSSQQEIRRLAQEFLGKYDRLDVLVNNAGAMFFQRRESVDGIELTFALNHLGYFLLTNVLLDRLKASAPARIVNVASSAHTRTPLDLDDVQSRRSYRGFRVYSKSKLANVLFTYELARRLEGTGVTANALHPGVVATKFGSDNGWRGHLLRPLFFAFGITPERGAETMIYLAASPEVAGVTGKYFMKKKAVPSSPGSYDRSAAARLWQISAELTGLPATTGSA